MHVVILAGGRGVRLRPYTTTIPKPLVPIGEEYAILDIILQQLRAQGFRQVILAIGHLGALIRAFASDGSRWGLKIDYIEEDKPLSTIGPCTVSRGMNIKSPAFTRLVSSPTLNPHSPCKTSTTSSWSGWM